MLILFFLAVSECPIKFRSIETVAASRLIDAEAVKHHNEFFLLSLLRERITNFYTEIIKPKKWIEAFWRQAQTVIAKHCDKLN